MRRFPFALFAALLLPVALGLALVDRALRLPPFDLEVDAFDIDSELFSRA